MADDLDAQDILALNLSRAVQLCVDIGAHCLADTAAAAPETMGQTFDLLAAQGIIDAPEKSGRLPQHRRTQLRTH